MLGAEEVTRPDPAGQAHAGCCPGNRPEGSTGQGGGWEATAVVQMSHNGNWGRWGSTGRAQNWSVSEHCSKIQISGPADGLDMVAERTNVKNVADLGLSHEKDGEVPLRAQRLRDA